VRGAIERTAIGLGFYNHSRYTFAVLRRNNEKLAEQITRNSHYIGSCVERSWQLILDDHLGRKLMVRKGGLPPLFECHSTTGGGKPTFLTMRSGSLPLSFHPLSSASFLYIQPT
jgi:hypothetical protein